MAPTISAATDVRFAEPGVAAETHTIARRDRDRRLLLLTEEERVAICALLTCVDIVDLVGVWSRRARTTLDSTLEAGKIRYFSSFRVWVVKVTILFFGQRERPAEGRPAGRELTRDASSLAKDRKDLFD